MSILRHSENSVLWLYASNDNAKRNLRKEAQHAGIEPERLIFADRVPLEQHISRLALADLFLDTHPYNAGATASNVLRAGIPIVTFRGNTFASRYGASLLTAVGMPELITASLQDYEDLAIELASEPAKYQDIRSRLARSVTSSPLFNTREFARNIEKAYSRAGERFANNLPLSHIRVN
jgi:predicted O-linked N-acetylglucosamine transferase (SPINDLY family)